MTDKGCEEEIVLKRVSDFYAYFLGIGAEKLDKIYVWK